MSLLILTWCGGGYGDRWFDGPPGGVGYRCGYEYCPLTGGTGPPALPWGWVGPTGGPDGGCCCWCGYCPGFGAPLGGEYGDWPRDELFYGVEKFDSDYYKVHFSRSTLYPNHGWMSWGGIGHQIKFISRLMAPSLHIQRCILCPSIMYTHTDRYAESLPCSAIVLAR